MVLAFMRGVYHTAIQIAQARFSVNGTLMELNTKNSPSLLVIFEDIHSRCGEVPKSSRLPGLAGIEPLTFSTRGAYLKAPFHKNLPTYRE